MATVASLRNRYWVLRHGRSIPNERGLIVASMENGMQAEYQLASEGAKQAHLAGELFQKELKLGNTPVESVRICYSPLSRTSHTARVVASVLNLPFEGPQCMLTFHGQEMKEIRERYFGPSFELKSHDKYAEIWDLDEKDPFMPPAGGESVADVAARLAIALATLESNFEGCSILIVSHGDPLQILQTMVNSALHLPGSSIDDDFTSRIEAARVPSILAQHRNFTLLTGELRPLIQP